MSGARERWAALALWGPGLAVALGAAVATAHGLFEVSAASGVPGGIAWIYPLITDGLAIVAYVATSRLTESGARYAWAVVILAAGLSGVAQAVYLAGGLAASASDGAPPKAPPEMLRFGVGAWPAIAAAIVAHLLFMLATERRTETPAVHPARVQTSPVQARGVQPMALDASAPSSPGERSAEQHKTVQPEASPESAEQRPKPERSTQVASSPKRDRARTEARKHAARHRALPTVDRLMQLAEVSRGTAAAALQELRDQPTPPHTLTELPNSKTNP